MGSGTSRAQPALSEETRCNGILTLGCPGSKHYVCLKVDEEVVRVLDAVSLTQLREFGERGKKIHAILATSALAGSGRVVVNASGRVSTTTVVVRYVGSKRVECWDYASSERVWVSEELPGLVNALARVSDGSGDKRPGELLAIGTRAPGILGPGEPEGQVLRLAPSTGQVVGEPTALHGGIMLMRVTADGQSLAVGTRRGEIVWLCPAQPDPITLVRKVALEKCLADPNAEVAELYGTVCALEIAPSGHAVVAGTKKGEVAWVQRSDGQLQGETTRLDGEITALCFAPSDGTVWEHVVVGTENSVVARLGADGVVRGATLKIGGPISIISFLPARPALAVTAGAASSSEQGCSISAGTVVVGTRWGELALVDPAGRRQGDGLSARLDGKITALLPAPAPPPQHQGPPEPEPERHTPLGGGAVVVAGSSLGEVAWLKADGEILAPADAEGGSSPKAGQVAGVQLVAAEPPMVHELRWAHQDINHLANWRRNNRSAAPAVAGGGGGRGGTPQKPRKQKQRRRGADAAAVEGAGGPGGGVGGLPPAAGEELELVVYSVHGGPLYSMG